MKTLLLVLLLAIPASAAEYHVNGRAGVFTGGRHDAAGTIEFDARAGNWSLTPAFEIIRGGYDQQVVHVDLRRHFQISQFHLTAAGGPTFIHSSGGSETTWNADATLGWRMGEVWEPFVAARYYRYRIPVFRDEVAENGAVISAGVAWKVFRSE